MNHPSEIEKMLKKDDWSLVSSGTVSSLKHVIDLTSVPQNVTLFGNGVFVEKIKLECCHYGGLHYHMTGVINKRRHVDTETDAHIGKAT